MAISAAKGHQVIMLTRLSYHAVKASLEKDRESGPFHQKVLIPLVCAFPGESLLRFVSIFCREGLAIPHLLWDRYSHGL